MSGGPYFGASYFEFGCLKALQKWSAEPQAMRRVCAAPVLYAFVIAFKSLEDLSQSVFYCVNSLVIGLRINENL